MVFDFIVMSLMAVKLAQRLWNPFNAGEPHLQGRIDLLHRRVSVAWFCARSTAL
jgi:hypothetical protein